VHTNAKSVNTNIEIGVCGRDKRRGKKEWWRVEEEREWKKI